MFQLRHYGEILRKDMIGKLAFRNMNFRQYGNVVAQLKPLITGEYYCCRSFAESCRRDGGESWCREMQICDGLEREKWTKMGCFFVLVQKEKGDAGVCRGVFVAILENVCRRISKNGGILATSHDAVDDGLFRKHALQVSVAKFCLNGNYKRQASGVR